MADRSTTSLGVRFREATAALELSFRTVIPVNCSITLICVKPVTPSPDTVTVSVTLVLPPVFAV